MIPIKGSNPSVPGQPVRRTAAFGGRRGEERVPMRVGEASRRAGIRKGEVQQGTRRRAQQDQRPPKRVVGVSTAARDAAKGARRHAPDDRHAEAAHAYDERRGVGSDQRSSRRRPGGQHPATATST